MLGGPSSIRLDVATPRYRTSVAHSNSEDTVRPTSDLGQTLNDLAVVVSVFVIKHTAAVSANRIGCVGAGPT